MLAAQNSNDLRLPLVSCSLYLIVLFFLSSESLGKPYRCSPQPAAHISCPWLSSDNRKTTNSCITLPRRYAKYTSNCSPVHVTREATPTQEAFWNMLLKQPISLGKKFWIINFWDGFLDTSTRICKKVKKIFHCKYLLIKLLFLV